MAQSSVAIERENNYDPDLPSKRPTDPTDHTQTKEVKRELSPVPLPPIVQVCPINVTQGDSILVKLKYKEGQEYNILIDGGHAKHLSNIEKCMAEYGVMKKDDIQLHCIIVTHPDGDHMNGIKKLLEKHGREILNCDIVLTRAFYWRPKDKMCEEFTTIIDSTCSKRNDNIEHITCLSPGLQCHFPKEQGCLLRYTPKDDKSKATPTQKPPTPSKPKDADTNETSILTVINESKGKCDVVLTGDSSAKAILPLVESKEIGMFQVPHHGSSFNSRLKDSTKLKELSECYDLSTIQDREVKETLLFYSRFKAQCYLVSAGGTDKHNHPHSQVLQGIILANVLRGQECVILVTNSRGLILQKIKPMHQVHIPEAKAWSRYVKIYHYNDVFEKQSDVVSLCPKSCTSDVGTSALVIEWTPEGYVRKIRTILSQHDPKMNDSRPQAKDCFKEKSRVEVILQLKGAPTFIAHVICVPVPHSPRSGDSINYCYVIEESIAPEMHFSQALFLLNDEKTTLPRAKNYILFQYTNNEWESKALGAKVQDCTRQISARDISFDDINESLRRSGDKDRLVKFLVKGCGCQKPCDTDHCICRKNKCPCAPYCRCSDHCKNNKVYPVSEPSSPDESSQPGKPSQRSQPESSQSHQTNQPIKPPSQPKEPIEPNRQPREPKQPSQLKKQDQPDQKFCTLKTL